MPHQEIETVPTTSYPYNGPRISLSLNMQQIFEEQMRKHVQLLTQTHLIAVQQVGLSSQVRRCRSMLNELLAISQSFDIANIQEAVQLVNYWESVAVKIPQDEIFSGGYDLKFIYLLVYFFNIKIWFNFSGVIGHKM